MFSRKKPPIRVLINGCGRLGRLAFRSVWDREDMVVVHVNEIAGDAPILAHLLQFDSIYGRWAPEVSSDGDAIQIDGQRVGFSQADEPSKIPFPESGVDLVLECSGRFKAEPLLLPYLDAGVQKVIVSAPMKTGGVNVIIGVNDGAEQLSNRILSPATGASNCLGLAVKVIHSTFGLKRGSFTAVQSLTSSQVLVDQMHRDPRRARAAAQSLIPTTSRAATVVPQVFPELGARLNGNAIRVPLHSASLMDCAFELAGQAAVEEVNMAFRAASEGELNGLLRVEDRPLVSVDHRGEKCSCVVDSLSTTVVENAHLRLYLWYDHEAAFIERMIELALKAWAASSGS